MIAAHDRSDGKVTDEDVSGNVLTMLLAGEDTTANTLAWMIWMLHRHLQAAQRVADEVRSVLGDGVSMPMAHELLGQLEYVEACAHETMRLKPVAPINIQQAVRDTVVAGIELPAGSLALPRAGRDEDVHAMLFAGFRIESVSAPGGGDAAERLALTMSPVGLGLKLKAMNAA